MFAKIGLEQISRACVFVNANGKSMLQIQKELDCDYIINGGLFDMSSFKPMGALTAQGRELSAAAVYGYALDGSQVTFSYANNVGASDFIGSYPCLIRNEKRDFFTIPAGLEGKRQRSCIGLTQHDLVLLCSQDKLSLGDAAGELERVGCVSAINLDGGGSSQCSFNGRTLKSGRIVHNFICIWTKKELGEKNMHKIYIRPSSQFQNYGAACSSKQPQADFESGSMYCEGTEMNLLADEITRIAQGKFQILRNIPGASTADVVADSNTSGAEIHVSLHSNAAGIADSSVRGCEALVCALGGNAEKLARSIYGEIVKLHPSTRGIKKIRLEELVNTRAPACLIEVDFHDNIDGATFIRSNRNAIANAVMRGIAAYFNEAWADVLPIRTSSDSITINDAIDYLIKQGIKQIVL